MDRVSPNLVNFFKKYLSQKEEERDELLYKHVGSLYHQAIYRLYFGLGCRLEDFEEIDRISEEFANEIKDRGIDVDLKNKSGNTALMLACKYRNTFFQMYLIKQNADPFVRDKGGENALDHVVCYAIFATERIKEHMRNWREKNPQLYQERYGQ